jgi:hypothetical protein
MFEAAALSQSLSAARVAQFCLGRIQAASHMTKGTKDENDTRELERAPSFHVIMRFCFCSH